MILQSLHALYDRLKDDPVYRIAPPGYSLQKITFRLVITQEGKLFELQDVRVRSGKQLRPKQMMVPGAAKPSGSGLNPCFLWDNTGYMLGYKPDDPKPERTAETFEAFRSKHLELEPKISSPAFSAVCRFLEAWDPARSGDCSVFEEIGTGFGVFQIQGQSGYIHDRQDVREWWNRELASHGDDRKHIAQCLITGKNAPIAPTHPKIKGVSGAQSSGAAIVSFNEPAYESYGKKQSYNAPVSEAAAFQYTTALNALLDGPKRDKHRLAIGDATVLFWTSKPTLTEDIFAKFASEGSVALENVDVQDHALREKLEAFLRAIRKGREAYSDLRDDLEQTSFFLLGLSANAARLSPRFFHRGNLSELIENLRQHYSDIRIKPQAASGKRKADPEFPPTWMLLRQAARESKDIPPILAGPLLRAIITGARYPNGLFLAVIRRIHADRTINYPRACIIRGYLTRNLNKEVSMSLDTERKDPAYRLGRLFAALEKTQVDALGKVGASIRDRFYSSASATPCSVFPRLLRTYQHHLAKLEGGRRVNREKLVQEVVDPLEDFPAHLNLAEQGLFAIGYYHQTRDFYTKKDD